LSFESSANGDKYYFEIVGRAGKMYLESYAFSDELDLDVDGQARTKSPLSIYPQPDAHWNPLNAILEEYYKDRNAPVKYDPVRKYFHNVSMLPECSITAEREVDQKVLRRTVHRFFRCRVLKLYEVPRGISRKYMIEFQLSHRGKME
jgi:hypothetical protein